MTEGRAERAARREASGTVRQRGVSSTSTRPTASAPAAAAVSKSEGVRNPHTFTQVIAARPSSRPAPGGFPQAAQGGGRVGGAGKVLPHQQGVVAGGG